MRADAAGNGTCVGTTQCIEEEARWLGVPSRKRASYTLARARAYSQEGTPLFTGLIHHGGVIASTTPTPTGIVLAVASHDWPDPPSPGASIAVNGCCLTLLAWAGGGDNALHFDVVPQTLDRTTLGSLGEGASVNLEPALRADQRLDGHLVQGHVDGVGTVAKVVCEGEYRLAILAPPEVAPYLSERGSITVDGVSLTIAAVDGAIFEVALIPATLESTTLGDLQEGMVVNLEADAFAKLVAQHVKRILGQQQR